MSSRRYTWNGFETTLSAGIASGTTVLPLTSVTGLRAPGYLVIDPDDLAKREYIEFATINSLSLEGCIRNGDGSVAGAVAHDSGATVRAVTVHQFLDDAFDDIEALETADTNHAAAADPHPGYVLNSELSDHAAAADPHAGYLLESGFTKAAIDALNVDADTLDGVDSTGFATSGHDHAANYAPASHVGSGGSAHADVSGSADGFMTVAQKNKLDGIESGATADQSAAEILTAVKTVDGAGSGLDADLLDGIELASLANNVISMTAQGVLADTSIGTPTAHHQVVFNKPAGWTTYTLMAILTTVYSGGAAGVSVLLSPQINGTDAGTQGFTTIESSTMSATAVATGVRSGLSANATVRGNSWRTGSVLVAKSTNYALIAIRTA